MKKAGALILICLTSLLSCKKVDFVPVIYEWFPLEYRVPVHEDKYYYVEPEYLGMFFRDSRVGFISVSNWFTSSETNLLLRTDDSCKSFIDLSEKITGFVRHMTFVSDSVMYLISNGEYLYKSTDAGLEWEEIDPPEYRQLSGIYSNPNGNVFLLSKETNKLWISMDGGETWTEQFKLVDPEYEDGLSPRIQFIGHNQDTGFINFMDTLFLSVDGGSSWNDHLYDSVHGFKDYQFLDFNTAYVHHDDYFYKSTDGGRTFDTVSNLLHIYDWEVFSENEAYCSRHLDLSDFTTILMSSDEFSSIAMMDFYHTSGESYFDYNPEIFDLTGPREGYAICSSGKLFRLDPALK